MHWSIYEFIYVLACISHSCLSWTFRTCWRDVSGWERSHPAGLYLLGFVMIKNRPALGPWIFNLMRASLLHQQQRQQGDYDISSHCKWLTLLRCVTNWNHRIEGRLWRATLKPQNIACKISQLTAVALPFEHFGIYHLFCHTYMHYCVQRVAHWARKRACEREIAHCFCCCI